METSGQLLWLGLLAIHAAYDKNVDLGIHFIIFRLLCCGRRSVQDWVRLESLFHSIVLVTVGKF